MAPDLVAIALQDGDNTEAALRSLLQERPRNARAMSCLSCLLAERMNRDRNDKVVDSQQLQREVAQLEALSLAQRADELAPEKPFGARALSVILPEFEDRMHHLRRAINLSSAPRHAIARIGLLVRLLVEPREYETRQVRGEVGRSSLQHPSRRRCTVAEATVYETIRQALQDVWRGHETNAKPGAEQQIEYLAKQEYRLGLFFRKREPLGDCMARSRQHFRRAHQKLQSSHLSYSLAQFWLATLGEATNETEGYDAIDTSIERCPKEYIVGLYSTFAERFDELLVDKLKYETPTKLRKLVDHVIASSPSSLRSAKLWAKNGVDLGCGTGLSGEAFRECVDHWTGVDLSPEMLAKARVRGCYDELVEGDCVGVLQGMPCFDLITACDVFVYIGDLRETFEAAHASLTRDGLFAFSTELLVADGPAHNRPYLLHICARFAHTHAYIESLAAEIGFEVCGCRTCPIRKNQGKDVIGSLVVLRVKQD